MEAVYSASWRVLVLSLPALVFRMADVLLLVAELGTKEPFRHAFDTLRPAYDTAASTIAVAYFKQASLCENVSIV
jgi:hypothetical protein